MSGSEELAQAEEEQVEGGEEYEGNEDDQELAAMQKELEKAEQQKAELDKLNKMQGTASADSKQSSSSPYHLFHPPFCQRLVCVSTSFKHSCRCCYPAGLVFSTGTHRGASVHRFIRSAIL